MSPQVELRIDLARVAWRTRGHSWDYTFICTPDETNGQLGDRWYDLLGEAFPSVASTLPDEAVTGTIDGTLRFIAARVVDPCARDSFDRPVWHEFLVTGIEQPAGGVPALWGSKLLAQLRDLLPDLSTLFTSDSPVGLRTAFTNLRRERSHVTISGAATDVPYKNLGRVSHWLLKMVMLVLLVFALIAVAVR